MLNINKLLICTLVLSSTTFAESQERRGPLFKNDICKDDKQKLERAQTKLSALKHEEQSLRKGIRFKERTLLSRKNTLNQKREDFKFAREEYLELKEQHNEKAQKAQKLHKIISVSDSRALALRGELREINERIKRSCLSSRRITRKCEHLKDQKEDIGNELRGLKSKKTQAQQQLRALAGLDQRMIDARKYKDEMREILDEEKDKKPSIASLQSQLTNLQNQLNDIASGEEYKRLTSRVQRLGLKFDKCYDVQFTARKHKVFKRHLIIFAKRGCHVYQGRMNRAQKDEVKAGIREAYKMICNGGPLTCEAAGDFDIDFIE